jgi:primosomal protein N' (replication factor Y) (superfamily II helicase)
MYFIDVILPLNLNKTFTYAVNEEEFKFIQIGIRVTVPFGKTKLYTALVTNKHQQAPQLYEAKDIYQILDEKPIVTPLQIEHWFWIASYYACAIGDVYKSAMPSSLILDSTTNVALTENDVNDQILSDDAFLVKQALESKSLISLEEISKIIQKKKTISVVNELLSNQVITVLETVKEKYTPKLVKYIKIHPNWENHTDLQHLMDHVQKFPKQKNVLLHYFSLYSKDKKPVLLKNLLSKDGCTSAIVNSLLKKDILQTYYLHEDRVIFKKKTKNNWQLNNAQQVALEEINKALQDKDVVLLHGVTASGKTEIYIKLIEQTIQKEQRVLFLLPEIALTTQLVHRLTAYFGNDVAVFHSKYSNNERVEVWQACLNNSHNAKIILGVRSALFLPLPNLGLIIIDEEHESTYKQQDPAPRYHARDAAIVLAKMHHAKVLLGSATPSIESSFNAQTGKYGLVHLLKRYNNNPLPEILLVDLKDTYFRKRMQGHFSDTLIENIQETLQKNEQVMLLQNRRGYSPYIECNSCGHVPQCPSCDVSLTFYKHKSALKCHYCGHSIAKPVICHQCSHTDIVAKGFGTEQIEDEVKLLFPLAKIARMDQDTTKGKFGYEKIIDAYKNKEIDILIGTQMLAKGLDFDEVTLVGVLNADNIINQPNYKSHEKAYQLLTQVAGRAGRKDKKGKVIIQTYDPLQSVIQQVVHHDYTGMYNHELNLRKNFLYPPYYRLIQVKLKHKDYQKLLESAAWLAQVFKNTLSIPVLGPEEPIINKIRNEYIRVILIKIPNNTNFIHTKKLINKVLTSFDAVSNYKGVKVILNVDY